MFQKYLQRIKRNSKTGSDDGALPNEHILVKNFGRQTVMDRVDPFELKKKVLEGKETKIR